MMYLNGKHGFVKDFFERTKMLIEHSEDCDLKVTLLCNCLTGMLIFPEQKFYDEMQSVDLTKENYERLLAGLTGNEKPSSVSEIFRHMRNAVSHCNIKFESETAYDNDTQIKYLLFYDSKNRRVRGLEKSEFVLKLDISDLKDILVNFCNELLKNEECV